MVRDENITPVGRDYDQIFDTLATADVDFYVDLTDIYGGQLIPNLGAGTVDAYGKGYDVMTSAKWICLVMIVIYEFTMMKTY